MSYHPQSNDKVEVFIWEIKYILVETMNTNRTNQAKELDKVSWDC